MKHRQRILFVAFAGVCTVMAAAVCTTPAFAFVKFNESQEPAQKLTTPRATVTPVQAMRSAEGKVGGKAVMAIFEFDEGHWIYGVVVKKNHKLMEVDVDPLTGKAGDSEEVTPIDEAKEFQDGLSKILKSSN